jgi:hypothetical protein
MNVVIGKHKRAVSLFQSGWWCDIPSALCGWRHWHTARYTTALGGRSWAWFPPFLFPSLRYGLTLGIWHVYLGLLLNNIAAFHQALHRCLNLLHVSRLWCYGMQLFPIQHTSVHHFHYTRVCLMLMPGFVFDLEVQNVRHIYLLLHNRRNKIHLKLIIFCSGFICMKCLYQVHWNRF